MFNFNTDKLVYGQYVYVGHQEGTFNDSESGDSVNYRNVFVIHQQNSNQNRNITGYVSEKLRVKDVSIFSDLVPGDLIRIFFDQYGRVDTVMKI